MSMLNVFQIAGSALNAQSLRLNTTASNLANADTVAGPDGSAYKARQVVFTTTPMGGPGTAGVTVSQVTEEVTAIFADMGFRVAEGPQIESDWFNFDALNIPPEHPARQEHDTFFMARAADDPAGR